MQTTSRKASSCHYCTSRADQEQPIDVPSKVVEGPGGEKCLVLSLPLFSNGGSAVLVDLETLECSEISFDVTSIAMSQ